MANLKEPKEDTLATGSSTVGAELLADSMGDYARILGRRIRHGESGALPVIVGLIAIVIFFWVKIPVFMTPGNLVNLMTQSAPIIMLGMAQVFVLLLGDIDLAAGFTAACAAVIMAWMLALGDPLWASVIVGLFAAAAYGTAQGLVTTRLGLPSFVVTLAGQLGLSGVLLYLVDATGSIGNGGDISLHNSVILAIEGGHLNSSWTWIVMIVIGVVTAITLFLGDYSRRSNGLVAPPVSITVLKMAVSIIACVLVAYVADVNRGRFFNVIQGMPWAVLLVLAVLVIWNVLLGRTRFGRYVYAIGGNAEAARRAGINVSRIRTLAFMLCGLTAGVSGILLASELGSIGVDVPGGQNVLIAVAAAVIGGTSLFGGRGKMLDAVLGGLVVGVIYNGLELLSLSAAAQEMWTAVVLLAAVIVDRVARQQSRAR
jgi:D-xylose transport system permease protein